MINLKQFIERASWNVEKIFNGKGEVLPMYHFVRRDGQQIVMPIASGNKDQATAAARAVFEQQDAVRYVFISEAWMLDMRGKDAHLSDTDLQRFKERGLEQEPGRIEAVMFAAEDENEPMLMACREIVRLADRKPYLAKLTFMPTGGELEGRMVALLPRKKLS